MYRFCKKEYDLIRFLFSIDQMKVFQAMGVQPVFDTFVVNPLRNDSTPGCFYDWYEGVLYLNDFTRSIYHHKNINCITFYMLKYKVSLDVAVENIKNMNFDIDFNQNTYKKRKKQRNRIRFQTRNFSPYDKYYWARYNIDISQLEKDNVYPVSNVYIKQNEITYSDEQCAFIINEWDDAEKVCNPHGPKKFKWLSSTTKNHIGFYNDLPHEDKKLIISKSYKDARVLKNSGFSDVCWLQSEGTIPDQDILFGMIHDYKEVIVLYDNDKTGKNKGQELVNIINKEYPDKSKFLCVPNNRLTTSMKITDPSDLIAYSQIRYNRFIRNI